MALAAHATDTAGHRVPQRLTAAWYGLAVLVVATIFAAIDRQILLLVTEPLKHALALSDSQIGALNGIALSLVAALAVFPMGWLADRVDRRTLLWVCVLVWSLATGACGLAQTFPQLFVCGMGIAVGEAILGPITYSIIPDLFPQDRWIIANYVFFLAGVVGGALGLSLSGGTIGLIEAHHAALPPLVAHLATWRVALLAVALPGPVIAVLIALIRTRPRIVSEAAERGSGLLAYFREHLRTLVGVFVGFGFAASAWGTIQTWMPVALVRVFGQTPAQTGVRLGITAAVASLIGVLASGLLVRKLRGRFGDHTPMRVAQFGIAVAALLTPLYLVPNSALPIYAIELFQIIAMTIALSLSPTMLQFIAPRLMRGRVIAVGGLIYIVFLSLSPLAVGAVSDLLPGAPKHLLWAMLAVSLPCYVAGVLFLGVAAGTLSTTMAAATE